MQRELDDGDLREALAVDALLQLTKKTRSCCHRGEEEGELELINLIVSDNSDEETTYKRCIRLEKILRRNPQWILSTNKAFVDGLYKASASSHAARTHVAFLLHSLCEGVDDDNLLIALLPEIFAMLVCCLYVQETSHLCIGILVKLAKVARTQEKGLHCDPLLVHALGMILQGGCTTRQKKTAIDTLGKLAERYPTTVLQTMGLVHSLTECISQGNLAAKERFSFSRDVDSDLRVLGERAIHLLYKIAVAKKMRYKKHFRDPRLLEELHRAANSLDVHMSIEGSNLLRRIETKHIH